MTESEMMLQVLAREVRTEWMFQDYEEFTPGFAKALREMVGFLDNYDDAHKTSYRGRETFD